ncbi:unnamed protein product [Caenorhabditis bovis]|uniref:Uncharacterized protein n=1 Tax=Caenorhabditis bovis TaxID=2654633 RepID=A0A8S1FEM1_9PELO|nr:unnamed protein product [Caenorhabditis bovis]
MDKMRATLILFVILSFFVGFVNCQSYRCIACMDEEFFSVPYFENKTLGQKMAWKRAKALPPCNDSSVVSLVECKDSCIMVKKYKQDMTGWIAIGRYFDCETAELAEFFVRKPKLYYKQLFVVEFFSTGTHISQLTNNVLDDFYNEQLIRFAVFLVVAVAIVAHFAIIRAGEIFYMIALNPNGFVANYTRFFKSQIGLLRRFVECLKSFIPYSLNEHRMRFFQLLLPIVILTSSVLGYTQNYEYNGHKKVLCPLCADPIIYKMTDHLPYYDIPENLPPCTSHHLALEPASNVRECFYSCMEIKMTSLRDCKQVLGRSIGCSVFSAFWHIEYDEKSFPKKSLTYYNTTHDLTVGSFLFNVTHIPRSVYLDYIKDSTVTVKQENGFFISPTIIRHGLFVIAILVVFRMFELHRKPKHTS